MKLSDARALLESLSRDDTDVREIVKIRDGVASLHITSVERQCVIKTPGERWFALDTELGYSHTIFDEDASDEDVAAAVALLVEAGRAYVRGEYEVSRSRVLGTPEVSVTTRSGPMLLTLSVADTVRHLFRIHRTTG